MQIAFLASPPVKNHLQHNLKKASLDAPSSPSMCRVYVYLLRATPPDPPTTHFVRQTQLRWRLLRRLAFVKVLLCNSLVSEIHHSHAGRKQKRRLHRFR